MTILIAARDAAATIERAIRSAVAQHAAAIVLVDDFSSDDTVAIARSAAPGLRVIRPPRHGALGFTRQCALDASETPFALWLDADDELMPGRTERLVSTLTRDGADLAFDEVELVDGASGRFLKRWEFPDFLDRAPRMFRLFERNYLPGVGQPAFRTAFARAIGYDADLHGPEDIDFVLRAIVRGGRVRLVREAGYRMHAYPSSVSRDLTRQRAMYKRALLKHSYPAVRAALARAGATAGVTAWTLVSLATYREEYDAALRFLDDADAVARPIDPGGPCPLPDGWRLAFQRGTLRLLSGDATGAVGWLTAAERHHATPEGANNLGVALARLGHGASARTWFERAVSLGPEFIDARTNLVLDAPDRITTHPLRRQPARTDYAIAV